MTTPTSASRSGKFTVLIVCTGNICRSPAARFILESSLGGNDSLRIDSAGTRAVVGASVAPKMVRELASAGLPTEPHEAKQLTRALIDDADLILGMTRLHRSEVVTLSPASLNRSYTLGEFARILQIGSPTWGDLPTGAGSRFEAVMPHANHNRVVVNSKSKDLADIPDPYGGRDADYHHAFDAIGVDTRHIIEFMTSSARPPESSS